MLKPIVYSYTTGAHSNCRMKRCGVRAVQAAVAIFKVLQGNFEKMKRTNKGDIILLCFNEPFAAVKKSWVL